MELKSLIDSFRDPNIIVALQKEIEKESKKLAYKPSIMEICGGHTHTIAKYSLNRLLEETIRFVRGPGCPVCVMPKRRIDHALVLAKQKDVVLVTLGDMIRVPGSEGSLQDARSEGCDVRFVYSPLDTLKIAEENPSKKVVFLL